MQPGETVLITGVLGAVGRAATQIAHWKNAKVIGADIADSPTEADAFVNSKTEDLAERVRALTNGNGADLVLDGVGGPMFEPSLKALRAGGRQVAIASLGNGRVDFNLIDFYHGQLSLIGVDTMSLTGAEIAGILHELRAGFEGGYLKPSAVQTWTMDQAIDAYTAVQQGGTSIKHVLLPQAGY
jgi:NADPH:quinone reductase-like Zn-dependent oxidoreductase